VDSAVALGANVVSMSWGTYGPGTAFRDDTSFQHPGVRFFASSGDEGYFGHTLYPAAAKGVTAVGGTSLHQATSTGTRNATETTWKGSGSGCDLFSPRPSWQPDVCSGERPVADVSADADPSTPVWVYDTVPWNGPAPNWGLSGGTSASAPILAGIAALAPSA